MYEDTSAPDYAPIDSVDIDWSDVDLTGFDADSITIDWGEVQWNEIDLDDRDEIDWEFVQYSELDTNDLAKAGKGADIYVARPSKSSKAIDGKDGDDYIIGAISSDKIIGGKGQDVLYGMGGVDTFIYNSTLESGAGESLRDKIMDFQGSQGEKIDLSRIDAYTESKGNQQFTYIGSNAFTGTKGEVRFFDGILQMSTGTDTFADMEIVLTGTTFFSESFLVL